ncbi:hypothetical protein JCGZ_26544 [Jatropha curcas]|uniref:Uncharacterized protein n=1 Tax=Jatropha curcas TaxID=180498 RepID=A0A067JWM6_JATCU|nr:hypothetical protein JCGZ_26544 [Jatropha curcas]
MSSNCQNKGKAPTHKSFDSVGLGGVRIGLGEDKFYSGCDSIKCCTPNDGLKSGMLHCGRLILGQCATYDGFGAPLRTTWVRDVGWLRCVTWDGFGAPLGMALGAPLGTALVRHLGRLWCHRGL